MGSKDDAGRASEERLRRLVPAGEDVVAVGAADEFPDDAEDFGGQGHRRFLVVTMQRLLVTDWSRSGADEEIVFDELGKWADGTQYHRYVVTLTHPSMTRNERVPAHRFLWFEWGDAYEPRSRSTTTLRFSHRDTAAATALRLALQAGGASHEALALKEVSREERTRGSHMVLTAENSQPPEAG